MRRRIVIAAAALAVVMSWAAPAGATLTINPGETIVYLGTSITHGVGYGPWYTPAETTIDASYQRAGTTMTTSMATATTHATTATVAGKWQPINEAPIAWNAGVVGDRIDQMTARLSTDVYAHNPTVVVIEGSVNDLVQSTGIPAYTANTTALVNALKANLPPTTKYLWVGMFCYFENYPDSSYGGLFDQYETVNRSAAASLGAAYVDVRTPQQAYEAAHNTPPPGAVQGILTDDGVHPNNTGIPLYTAAFLANVTLSGTP